MTPNPMIVDLSHYQVVHDMDAVQAFGIKGSICKATEGPGLRDDHYGTFRKQFTDRHLLFGAYHFLRPGNMKQQAQRFLDISSPDASTEVALDHEDDRVPLEDARAFCEYVAAKLGRLPILYSGFLIKQQLGNRNDPFWAQIRLWLCQYSSAPVWPANWSAPWLWQYTGDGMGPTPHNVPGIGNSLDINSYAGTVEQLTLEWAARSAVVAPPTVPSHDTKWLQASLNTLGATPVLDVDGDYGKMTAAAVKAFQTKNGLTVDGDAGPVTTTKIIAALKG